jgi:hypothetical protein
MEISIKRYSVKVLLLASKSCTYNSLKTQLRLDNSTEYSPSLEANSYSYSKKIALHIMETQCSLQCSQELATGPCSEPNESSPHHSNTISLKSALKIYIQFCHPSYRLVHY